jgi:hypothetical protein
MQRKNIQVKQKKLKKKTKKTTISLINNKLLTRDLVLWFS